MTTRTIAPTLAGWLHNAQAGADADAADLDAMRRELRALGACASALDRLLTKGKPCAKDRDVCGTWWDETCPSVIRGRRALARLRRVSGAGARKGKR